MHAVPGEQLRQRVAAFARGDPRSSKQLCAPAHVAGELGPAEGNLLFKSSQESVKRAQNSVATPERKGKTCADPSLAAVTRAPLPVWLITNRAVKALPGESFAN